MSVRVRIEKVRSGSGATFRMPAGPESRETQRLQALEVNEVGPARPG